MPLPTLHPSSHHRPLSSRQDTPSPLILRSHRKPRCRPNPHIQHSKPPSLHPNSPTRPQYRLTNPSEALGDSQLPPKLPTGHSHPRSAHTTGTAIGGITPMTTPTTHTPSPPKQGPTTQRPKHPPGFPHLDSTAPVHHNPSTRPQHHRHPKTQHPLQPTTTTAAHGAPTITRTQTAGQPPVTGIYPPPTIHRAL